MVLALPPCLWLMPVIGMAILICLVSDIVEGSTLTRVFFSFALSVIRASKGEKGIVEPTFVHLNGIEGGEAIIKETGLEYFSMPVELGVRTF